MTWIVNSLAVMIHEMTKRASTQVLSCLTEDEASRVVPATQLRGALRWRGSDGHWVYPSFQFSLGEVHPQVLELVDCFATAFEPHMKTPPLSIATAWLLSMESDDGRVGVDLLRDSETPFLMREEVSGWLAELVAELWGKPDDTASICIECHVELETVEGH